MTKKAQTEARRPARPEAKAMLIPLASVTITKGANAREDFDQPGLLQLAASIQDIGLLQPIVVAKKGSKYALLAGERRLRAAKDAGEEHIEARVYAALDDRTAARIRLAENFDRRDLNHIETGRALQAMVGVGMTTAEIAEDTHKGLDFVRRHLDLLRLGEPVRKLVASGRLPVQHGLLIARVGDVKLQEELAGQATHLEYDSKAKDWRAITLQSWQKGAAQQIRDYVEPMDNLRESVARGMLALAAHGWPKAEDFAGRRACDGCPDNTESYKDQPTLFAGMDPRGNDRKGHCTNRPCYARKALEWDKIKVVKAKAAGARRKEKAAAARTAGLDVCARCERVAQADEKFAVKPGGKICQPCLDKGKKALNRAAPMVPKRKFPDSPTERFAVALHAYGCRLVKALHKEAKKRQATTIPELVDAIRLAYFSARLAQWTPRVSLTIPGKGDKLPELTKALSKGTSGSADLPAGIIGHLICSIELGHRWRPSYDTYDGKPCNVPLPVPAVKLITAMEALAARWLVKGPEWKRPAEADFAAKPAAKPKPKKAKAKTAKKRKAGTKRPGRGKAASK